MVSLFPSILVVVEICISVVSAAAVVVVVVVVVVVLVLPLGRAGLLPAFVHGLPS